MNEQPIIVKYLSQKCVGYRFEGMKSVSIFDNVAVDKDGNTWQFTSETVDSGDGMTRDGRSYDYVKVSEAQS